MFFRKVTGIDIDRYWSLVKSEAVAARTLGLLFVVEVSLARLEVATPAERTRARRRRGMDKERAGLCILEKTGSDFKNLDS